MKIKELIPIWVLLLIFSIFYQTSRCSTSKKLYQQPCDVFNFDNSNFTTVLKTSESAYFVVFYSSWCGHCIKFEPTWKHLATDTKGWRTAVKVGAVDCAIHANIEICRNQNIEGYPTLKFFLAKPKLNGTVIVGKTFEKHQAGVEELKKYIIDSLQTAASESEWRSESFDPNRLAPYSGALSLQEDLRKRGLDPENVLIVAIYESGDSLLGREMILDTSAFTRQVMVYRFVVETEKIKGLPAPAVLVRIYSNGNTHPFAFDLPSTQTNTSRQAFRYILNKNYDIPIDFKVHSVDHKKKLDKTVDEAKKSGKLQAFHKKMRLSKHAHLQDLNSGLWYSLTHEIAAKKLIDGDKFTALKEYINVLWKYFPGRSETKAYLKNLLDKINNDWKTSVTGEQFGKFLESSQTAEQFIPHSKPLQYTACRGSKVNLRGYTCSLWELFHTLSVNWYLAMKEAGQEHSVEKKMEILDPMKSYVLNFFSCKECVQNFQKHADAMEKQVKDVEDSVLYLWKAHNKVNKRLAKDEKTNDPLHPKVQFPPKELCPACRKSNALNDWDDKQVLSFLVSFYKKENLVKDYVGSIGAVDKKVDAPNYNPKLRVLNRKVNNKEILEREKRLSEKEVETKDRIDLLKMREINTRHHKGRTRSVINSWGLSNIDISMCVLFYIVCSFIILMLYFHFTVRRKYRCKHCQV